MKITNFARKITYFLFFSKFSKCNFCPKMSESNFFSFFRAKTYRNEFSARKRNKFIFCFPQKQFCFRSLFVLVEISVCRFSFFSKIYEELSERKSWDKFKFSRYKIVRLCRISDSSSQIFQPEIAQIYHFYYDD